MENEEEDAVIKRCPNCGSKRISRMNTYTIDREINVSTGKFIKRKGTTNTAIIRGGILFFWLYKCRKCGWASDTFRN